MIEPGGENGGQGDASMIAGYIEGIDFARMTTVDQKGELRWRSAFLHGQRLPKRPATFRFGYVSPVPRRAVPLIPHSIGLIKPPSSGDKATENSSK